MAKKWSEVAGSDGFKALAPEQQDDARRQYFDEVVAPQVPGEHQSAAWDQFSADSGMGIRVPPVGGTGSTDGAEHSAEPSQVQLANVREAGINAEVKRLQAINPGAPLESIANEATRRYFESQKPKTPEPDRVHQYVANGYELENAQRNAGFDANQQAILRVTEAKDA